MADSDVLAAAFEENREHLRSVAYRLLGSMSDADDAVQDTWLRLTSTDTSEVENLGGWMTTIVARISLNMLRARQRRHEQPVGDFWPGAAELATSNGSASAPARAGIAPGGSDPEDEAVLADSVGLALLVVLDTLTPAERLAFVLHDMFAMPFTEVSAVLGRSTESTRQLASRARRRVRGAPSPDHANLARQREIAEAFLAAARGGDLAALVALLDSDVTLTADAAATPAGRPMVLQGVTKVSRGATVAAARAAMSQLALVDDRVGIVYAPGGHLEVVLLLAANNARMITAIEVIADPERLQQLQIALLPN